MADTEVVGVIIGTRRDCMPDRLLLRLDEVKRVTTVIVEYRAQSSHNETLNAVNR